MLDAALDHLIRGIVDNPEDVEVNTRNGRGRGNMLDVVVNPDDMGRVIGRQGRTANALRTVVKAISPNGSVGVNFLDVDER